VPGGSSESVAARQCSGFSLRRDFGTLKDEENRPLSKRKQMDRLYDELRDADFNLRLRLSREFVRTLVEHTSFVPQGPKHRIENAERAALKLKAAITAQEAEQEENERAKRQAAAAVKRTYEREFATLRDAFESALKMKPQARGYALEKIFPELMRISGIPVVESFRIVGEF
jgi:hypothetical protein